jgi:hypothetical protein
LNSGERGAEIEHVSSRRGGIIALARHSIVLDVPVNDTQLSMNQAEYRATQSMEIGRVVRAERARAAHYSRASLSRRRPRPAPIAFERRRPEQGVEEFLTRHV